MFGVNIKRKNNMHYVVETKDGKIIKTPITAEAAKDLPAYAKDMATVAERHQSHIEIDADTGIVHTPVNDGVVLTPTQQVAKAVEIRYIHDKYNFDEWETIKKIKSKAFEKFKGHAYAFIFIALSELQCSLIILDEDGNYLASYDELEEKFIPAVEGLGEDAVKDAKIVFERATEQYKDLLKETFKNQLITK
jgi:nitrogen regulatory protein PII-like uncharacterized protein